VEILQFLVMPHFSSMIQMEKVVLNANS